MLLGTVNSLDLSCSFHALDSCVKVILFPGLRQLSIPYSIRPGAIYLVLLLVYWLLSLGVRPQYGERTLCIPLVDIPGSPLNPASVYEHLCSLVPAAASQPAFKYWRKHCLVPFTYPVELLRTHGDRCSLSYLCYLDFYVAQRTVVTQLMASAL